MPLGLPADHEGADDIDSTDVGRTRGGQVAVEDELVAGLPVLAMAE